MRTAVALILLATGYRIVAAWNPELVNFSPLMALAFCGAVYFRNRWMWLVPFVALSASDLYLDHYHATQFGYTWTWAACSCDDLFRRGIAARLDGGPAQKLAAPPHRLSRWLAAVLSGDQHRVVPGDAFYAKTWPVVAGHDRGTPRISAHPFLFPQHAGERFAFTGVFVLAMEWAALRAGEPSLLKRHAQRTA